MKTFHELGIEENILSAIKELDFETPDARPGRGYSPSAR